MTVRPPTPLDTPCREWRGARDKDGYGRIARGKRRPNGRRAVMGLHRWVWEQVHGPLSSGQFVMHRCDNPPCFRYDHLTVGTVAENTADRVAKGRSSRHGWTTHLRHEQHSQAKLTWAQVREIRSLLEAGVWQDHIALRFGISQAAVSKIRNRKTWNDDEP